MAARGSAEWKGDLKGGSGTFKAGDDISGQYSFKTRFEGEPGANPEQLIGGAYASCFSMALANMLSQEGNVPDSIATEATVKAEITDDGPAITRIDLVTTGAVPGLSEEDFQAAAEKAKSGCPVGKALAGVKEINLKASLAS